MNNAKLVSQAHGNPEGSVQEELVAKTAISRLYRDRLIGLANLEPLQANEQLKNVQKQGLLTQKDYDAVDTRIRGTTRAVQSVNVANKVFDESLGDDGNPKVPRAQLEAEVRKRAKAIAPNDPLVEQHAVQALNGRYNQHNYSTKEELTRNLLTVQGGIISGVRNEQELRAKSPQIAAAIDALPESQRLTIPGRINRYNAARDQVTSQETYQRLYGLSNNDAVAFLETDLTKEKLSQSDMRQLQARQEKLRKVPTQDPMVQKFVSIMRGNFGAQMQELGVYSRNKDNPEKFDQMTGAVSGAIDAWTQSKSKPPTPQEFIKDIAPQILYQRDERYGPFNWFGERKARFQPDVEKFNKFSEKLKSDFSTQGLPEPSPAELQRAYMQTLMNELFAKKKEAK